MNGNWTTTYLAGKPADVFAPPDGIRPRYGLLFLHDFDGQTLAQQPAIARMLAELRLACVCPHGKRSFWLERVCPEFDPAISAERHLLDQALPYFEREWGIRPPGVGLWGFGMGGQGALRLAFRHAKEFPVVAAIAPSLEFHELYYADTPLGEMYDSKEQCRQDTAILHVPPYNPPPHIYFCADPDDVSWHRGADRLHEKMNAIGVPHESDLTTEAGGHTWDYFHHMANTALRFLIEGLEKEGRRLI